MITIRDQHASSHDDRVVVVLTTWPVDPDPAPIAAMLVEEQLAACVNVLPAMHSIYRWQGATQRDAEHQLLIKTRSGRVSDLGRRLRELHPYDVPELLVMDVEAGSNAYPAWVTEVTR